LDKALVVSSTLFNAVVTDAVFYYYLRRRLTQPPGLHRPTNKRMEDDDQDLSLESGVGGGASGHGICHVPRLENAPHFRKSGP